MTFDRALELALNEEELGRVSNTDEPVINVYGNEGNLPHLHFKNKRVESCIRLDEPKYFCHKPHHDGLNAQERKWFLNWIQRNWVACVNLWNKDTIQEKISNDIKNMPDYKLLPYLNSSTGKLNKEDRR